MSACFEGHLEVTKFLINNAANVNVQSKVFDTHFYYHNLFTAYNPTTGWPDLSSVCV